MVLGLVGVLHVPLGGHLARVFTTTRHWRAETVIYRACGINPGDDQPWTHYAVSVLAVSGAGILLLYLLLRVQGVLPFSFGRSLRTDGPMFVSLALGVAFVLVFLTFLPALSLGPLAEGLR